MKLSDLQFDLPERCIAQRAVEPRDAARMLVQVLGEAKPVHRRVSDLPDCLREGDLLVFNDTKVLPARIWAHRESGARIEVLFLEPLEQDAAWKCMVRPAKKPKPGECLRGPEGLELLMIERVLDTKGQASAYWKVQLSDPHHPDRQVSDLLEQGGEMPLPPYIHREPRGDGDETDEEDRERYQTVYSRHRGAVAAPTAGLHFTEDLLQQLQGKGISSAFVTLHVGLGTFLPIQVEELSEHQMHEERFEVDESVVRAVEACRGRGGRVIAVGTTSARALEAASAEGQLEPMSGRTDLFIWPGYSFVSVDGLLTNFHLPGSTLLLLVSALVGRDRLLNLYQQAIDSDYRFYSYGDAMLLLP
jgi:S-adenosylmethionine:tRNA ribosyltransferase-isomerase